MFYVRLLLFSILVYNTEAWYDDDYSDQFAYTVPTGAINSTITDPVIKSTSTNGTDPVIKSTSTNGTGPKPILTISNLTTPVEPVEYRLNKTETYHLSTHAINTTGTLEHSKDNETKSVNDEEESEPYYRDWYKKPEHSGTTTTESSYDGYNDTTVDDIQPGTNIKKPYDNNDEYGYLTIENGYLTAHFPEASNETEMIPVGVEPSKQLNQTTDSKNIKTATDNSETTTTRPYHYDWFTTTTRKSPRYTTTKPTHRYPSWGGLRNNSTYVIRGTSTRRSFWWNPTTTTESTNRTYWPGTVYNRTIPVYRPTDDYPSYYPHFSNHSIFLNNTNARSIYRAKPTTHHYPSMDGAPHGTYVIRGTSTRRSFWWDPTTTTESTNRTYGPVAVYDPRRTYPVYRPTTEYPSYYIRSTGPPSLDQSIFPNNTNETSIYGTVVDFLKKLTRTISPSGVKIIPNSNITNVALANGNGNTIFYAYNYF